jgi:hypothetical protein
MMFLSCLEDYDPVDCVLIGRPHYICEKEISVTKMIPNERDMNTLVDEKSDSNRAESTSLSIVNELDTCSSHDITCWNVRRPCLDIEPHRRHIGKKIRMP